MAVALTMIDGVDLTTTVAEALSTIVAVVDRTIGTAAPQEEEEAVIVVMVIEMVGLVETISVTDETITTTTSILAAAENNWESSTSVHTRKSKIGPTNAVAKENLALPNSMSPQLHSSWQQKPPETLHQIPLLQISQESLPVAISAWFPSKHDMLDVCT
jgi:hypothetical protein